MIKKIKFYLDYYLLVWVGFRPIIELTNGTVYDLHPQAIRHLKLTKEYIRFTYTKFGVRTIAFVKWDDIIYFGADIL